MVYQVYGRKQYDVPLTLLGELEVAGEGEEGVQQAALSQYGSDWIELVAARVEDVIPVALKWGNA